MNSISIPFRKDCFQCDGVDKAEQWTVECYWERMVFCGPIFIVSFYRAYLLYLFEEAKKRARYIEIQPPVHGKVKDPIKPSTVNIIIKGLFDTRCRPRWM